MRPLNLTHEVRRRTRKENPMPYRLIAALCLCLLGLLQQARAESCASILARAEYPHGRDITLTVPMTMVTSDSDWRWSGGLISSHSLPLSDTIRIPDDAPGPVDLAFRLTQDLPDKGRQHFNTDIPGVGLSVDQSVILGGMILYRLKPGESLTAAVTGWLNLYVYQISDDLVPGILDLSRLPGIKVECADEQAAPAFVMRLGGSLNIQTATCEVQQEQVVDLGEHTVSSLKGTSPWVDFSLRFSNCTPFYKKPYTSHDADGSIYFDINGWGTNGISVRVQNDGDDGEGAYGSSALIRLDAAPSSDWWLHPLLIELQINNGYGWWGSARYYVTDQAEYNIPMRARYYRMNKEVPVEPGPKNASAVLLIRYE